MITLDEVYKIALQQLGPGFILTALGGGRYCVYSNTCFYYGDTPQEALIHALASTVHE